MSAPPPPYQNQPPQQPYGYPQQPYGQQQPPQPYGQQPQQYPYPQQQGGPQRPPQRQASPLRGLITAVIVLAVFGGGAWYVWNYNTDPNGGKAKAEASASARAEENKKYAPQTGDCIDMQGTPDAPRPLVVDCGSPQAEYKTGERLDGGGRKCGPQYDTSIVYSGARFRSGNYTLCFTKV